MRRLLWMSLAALLVFAAVLVTRAPARWLAALLPSQVQCLAAQGTLWNGHCDQLTVRNTAYGSIDWQLHAATLLRGALTGTAQLQRPDGSLTGNFEARIDGRISALDLRGDLPLDPALLPGLPANWSGRLQVDVPRLTMKEGRVQLLQGAVVARDILASGPRPDAFGSYELRVQDPPDAAGRVRGVLRSLEGPFALDAGVVLEPAGIWELKGTIAAGPGASPALARQLELLGSPDASGRRNFSLSNRQ